MADQFVSKIGNQYIVSVCYVSETNEIRTASFGAPVGVMEVTWNLMTLGSGEPAQFNSNPIESLPSGACFPSAGSRFALARNPSM